MGTNVQVKLMLPGEVADRLSDYAEKYRRRSLNKVAIEILEFYSEAWAVAEEARQAIISQQTAGANGASIPVEHLADLNGTEKASKAIPVEHAVDYKAASPAKAKRS